MSEKKKEDVLKIIDYHFSMGEEISKTELDDIMSKKQNIKITIELSDKQQEKYDKWILTIKTLYGKYGNMTWSVSDCGIGQTIKVYNDITKLTLDLTDVDEW